MGEETVVEAAARAAEQARELQDAAAALLSRTWAEEEALRRRAAVLGEELARLRKAAASADSDKVTCFCCFSLLPNRPRSVRARGGVSVGGG